MRRIPVSAASAGKTKKWKKKETNYYCYLMTDALALTLLLPNATRATGEVVRICIVWEAIAKRLESSGPLKKTFQVSGLGAIQLTTTPQRGPIQAINPVSLDRVCVHLTRHDMNVGRQARPISQTSRHVLRQQNKFLGGVPCLPTPITIRTALPKIRGLQTRPVLPRTLNCPALCQPNFCRSARRYNIIPVPKVKAGAFDPSSRCRSSHS